MTGRSRCRRLLIPAVWLTALTSGVTALADTIDAANITTFTNGQPALAGQVNGNFDELITQIDDHAARLTDVEASGVVTGDDIVSVDCGTDGPDALHEAINSANHAVGTLTVLATGACSEVAILRRNVVIQGTDLSITADSTDPRADGSALQILASDVRMFSGPGSNFFSIAGNGEPGALTLNQDAQVLLIGVTVDGATDIQAAVSGFSTLAFLGSNTIGAAADGAVSLRLLQSRVLLLTGGPLSQSTLNLNSSGTAIEARASSYATLELIPGSTQLNIPNSPELDFAMNAVGIFGPFSFGSGAGETIRISDNSSIHIDGASLFDGNDSATILSDLVIDRGGALRVDFENAPETATLSHSGNVEAGLNSVVDVFGRSGASDAITLAAGSGSAVDVNINSSVVMNAATFAADTLRVLNSTVAFGPGAVFDDGQPQIDVSYGGTVIDLGSVLTGDVNSCTAGGTAYDSVPSEACPP